MAEIRIGGSDTPALVDDEFAYLANHYWQMGRDGYPRRKSTTEERAAGAPCRIAMHREVVGLHLEKGGSGRPDVDHINGRKLDNRTENLRICSRSLNNLNRHRTTGRSSHVGVSFFKPAKLWRAYITISGKRTEIGYFRTEEAAAAARRNYEQLHVPPRAPSRRTMDCVNG